MERRHKLTSGCEQRNVLYNVVTNTIELQYAALQHSTCMCQSHFTIPKRCLAFSTNVTTLLNNEVENAASSDEHANIQQENKA
jgi:hypothetical protein